MCMSNVERSIGLHRSYVQEKWCMANNISVYIYNIYVFYDFNAKKIIINIYGNSTETILLKKFVLTITRSLMLKFNNSPKKYF